MVDKTPLKLLVGDNPFHRISHLSQERSRLRGNQLDQTEYASNLVSLSLRNGAAGFMFTVSDTTLAILKVLRERGEFDAAELYAIVPYAYEYVRLATQTGGLPGIAKNMAKRILFSMNLRAIGAGVKAVLTMDPVSLMKTYVYYELDRIRSVAGKQVLLKSLSLHEVVTDMALALDLKWLFESYSDFLEDLGIEPGFETRNFPFLVNKFEKWGLDFKGKTIISSFNRAGFQMNPSKVECEEALARVAGADMIAMSVLAAGYLKPREAMSYIRNLRNLSGVVVGVSRESQAEETFQLLKDSLKL